MYWDRALRNHLNMILPGVVLLILAIAFIIWESLIRTMGFNHVLMLFSMLVSVQSMMLLVKGRGNVTRQWPGDSIVLIDILVVVYSVLRFGSITITFGP